MLAYKLISYKDILMEAQECIFFQLAKTSQAGSRFWSRKISRINLTAAQAMVIRFLYDKDRLTSSQLGKRTKLDSATLTGIIDRLETAGLVERRRNSEDRRSIRLHLTHEGRKKGKIVKQLMEEANKEFLHEFNESEEVALRTLLNRIMLRA
jgi:MarR family transcriptional regulator, organic hydroperoxide resistance regulator